MPKLAIIYDPQSGNWLRFSRPVEELEIHAPGRVVPTLDYLEERAERDGLFAAGFVSYEAAPAFDDALQTEPPAGFPLLRFGLFKRPDLIELPAPDTAQEFLDWQAQETESAFSDKVEQIRVAIAHGETYQVNLTFPLTADYALDPWQFFLHLARSQPASGTAYLQAGRWCICSVSPELFFSRNGDCLTMRPMKGTAPRGMTLAEDRHRAGALQQSAKNRAENIMILDMVRNDLGRLAPPGEVHTTEVCTLERYPTVWQMTSTVKACCNASLAEVFRALFPCASITGAPKARTMQIIRTVEKRPRQIYTGTFGWIAPGRQARFNVAIRTALFDSRLRCASYGVGAGITWDSDGADEYRECLDKAAVLSSSAVDFALIETLRWAPAKGYFLLQEHLSRLQSSAEYFDFACSSEQVATYLKYLSREFPGTPQRVRLLLHKNGQIDGKYTPLVSNSRERVRICLALHPVDADDPLLYHKTTQRGMYENSLARAEDADEVVLWNRRGEVTECCTANLVVEKAGRLITPPLACGLLPGTYRDFLLRRGILSEQVVSKQDLYECNNIYLINAVRKWRRAVLIRYSPDSGKKNGLRSQLRSPSR